MHVLFTNCFSVSAHSPVSYRTFYSLMFFVYFLTAELLPIPTNQAYIGASVSGNNVRPVPWQDTLAFVDFDMGKEEVNVLHYSQILCLLVSCLFQSLHHFSRPAKVGWWLWGLFIFSPSLNHQYGISSPHLSRMALA